jgi:hypothetical protein
MSDYWLLVLDTVFGGFGAFADLVIVALMIREARKPVENRRYGPWLAAMALVTVAMIGPSLLAYRLSSNGGSSAPVGARLGGAAGVEAVAGQVAPPKAAPMGANPIAAVFVKNQSIGATSSNEKGTQPAVIYHAEFATTGEHLRAFVEYRFLESDTRGMKPVRIALREFKSFVKNDDLSLVVVSRDDATDGQYTFKWGEKSINAPALNPGGKYYARINLVGDDGKEQHEYFILFTGLMNATSYPNIIPGENLDFGAQWEKSDARP